MTTRIISAASPALVITVACMGIFVLTLMDAVMKGLVLAIGVYNTMLWRSLAGTVASGVAWTASGASVPAKSSLRLHVLRGIVVVFVATGFFWGLSRLPIAEAITLSFIAPLIALYLAALLLGERVGKIAIWASVIGLVGVGVILSGRLGASAMSEDAAWGAAAVLFSAVFYAWSLILLRKQAQLAGPLEIAFFQNATVATVLAMAAPWLAQLPPADLWPQILLATALNLAGLFFVTWAFARAEAQYLAPVEYTAFVWAALLGWFIFDEKVEWTTAAGTALIVAGCLLVALVRPKALQTEPPAV